MSGSLNLKKSKYGSGAQAMNDFKCYARPVKSLKLGKVLDYFRYS